MSKKLDGRLTLTTLPECAICLLPCPLETCEIDAHGKAVHQECFVARTLGVPLHEE